jgi:hypothetical protein
MDANEYRRSMGFDMIRDHQHTNADQPIAQAQKPDERKKADEECQGIDPELLKGVVLGTFACKAPIGCRPVPDKIDFYDDQSVAIGAANPDLLPAGVTYFASLDEYIAWYDGQRKS